MSILIIGGLFAVALLAVLGLVFLLRGGAQTSKKNVTKIDNEPLKLSDTSAIATGGAPTQPGLPAPSTETETIPAYTEIERFPVANGQFHRLSVELHSLHGQAQEIEDRLGVLTTMVERIENDQRYSTHIEEDTAPTLEEPTPAN